MPLGLRGVTRVNKHQLSLFLSEAREALEVAKQILSEHSLEEFMHDMEARYALRHALVLLVEALADALTLILEADHGVAPESYREAMLLGGEAGIIPYEDAEELAKLASLRNVLIHRYWRVDDARLYRETGKGLEKIARVLEALSRYAEDSDP